MEATIPVIVGVVAATIAVALAVTERRAARIDRKRQLFAEALGDVLKWTEFPYRIRRRAPGGESAHEIATAMHDLQTRLAHHRSWLRLESPSVSMAFDDLLAQARELAASQIREAWDAEPVLDSAGMNLGDEFRVDLTAEIDAFVAEVRRTLSWRKEWP
jgi:hypothetical protein